MRPGSSPLEVIVLDTKTECQVLHEAFVDEEFLGNHRVLDPNAERAAPDTIPRFLEETRRAAIPVTLPSSGQPIYSLLTGEPLMWPEQWQPAQEFSVTIFDVDIVQKAAQRIVEQDTGFARHWNRLTGRTKVAKQILSVTTQWYPLTTPLDPRRTTVQP